MGVPELVAALLEENRVTESKLSRAIEALRLAPDCFGRNMCGSPRYSWNGDLISGPEHIDECTAYRAARARALEGEK